MAFRKIIFLCLSLLFAQVMMARTDQETLHDFLHHCGKIAQAGQNNAFARYSKKVIKISNTFEAKYGNKPRLKCMTCKKYTLTHGELIGQIYLQSLDAFVDAAKSNTAKTFMYKAFEIFPVNPLSELLLFMLQAANELPISCEACLANHWEIIEEAG